MPLIDCLSTTDELSALFSDASVLQALLDVEAALARAAARAGAVPASAGDVITAAARADEFDADRIARDARGSATPAIPLIRALTARVRSIDPAAADYVHWGATSQDITDTAMVLLLARAQPILERHTTALEEDLRALSNRHAGTVMLGRTLLQPATPTTFGLKAAGWYCLVRRGGRRLARAWEEALVVQFGGASGTLAALGPHAGSVAARFGEELGLRAAPPWHTDRDRPGALVTACGLHTAALGKIARDVSLLMQAEVGEAAEPGGGSSTMPHKRNPARCAGALAAAARMPGLVAAFLTGMVQEHERGLGGIQAEWPTIAAVVQTTGAAVEAVSSVVHGLSVDPERMRSNLESLGGAIFAERAVMLLAPRVGRDAAQGHVATAVERSRASGIPFEAALRQLPEVAQALSAEEIGSIARADEYLGVAEALRQQMLETA